ncbi:MAG: DUF2155 domain-containing protein [Marinibacterium sp.]|nr:DUF2155 domain-containing protein [Marinibacterium sp.]
MRRWLTALLICAPVALSAQGTQEARTGSSAMLRALDKVNGRTVDVTIPTGQTAQVFGLEVFMVECRYPAQNPTGDAWAFVVMRETGGSTINFQGWMVASSPALNALDHPRYDVWVLRCNND